MAFSKATKTGASKDLITEGWDKFNDLIDDLLSTSSGLGASQIGIQDSAGNMAATNVETALAEIYTDIASGTSFSNQFDENSDTTTGTTWGYEAGLLRSSTAVTTVATGTIGLTDDDVNYVEIDSSGVVSKNTTSFTAGKFALRTITVASGVQTVSTDSRVFFDIGVRGVAQGGTGAATLTDGGVLLGSGTGAITAMAVLTDGQMIVGDGTTDPVAESGATLRTSIGVGTGDSPQFTGIELGHATDTTLTRASAGDVNIQGNIAYRAGGTDVAVADGGTGAGTATAGFDALSPMTTVGDIIYGGASGTGTRLAAGATTELLVGGGAAAPVWTTATGTGAPVRAASPILTGNVGLAVTPESDWNLFSPIQIGGTGAIWSNTAAAAAGQSTFLSQNVAYTTGNTFEYLTTDEASVYQQTAGTHVFQVAVSGTGGTAIGASLVTALTIGNSGDVTFAEDIVMASGKLIGITGDLDLITLTSGVVTVAGNIVIADAGTIGSASDTDAISISSGGEVGLTAGQLNFPDTQNASADVNTLDDYEEGEYTATITCSTSGSYTLGSNNNVLAYTKIGRLVQIQGHLNVTGESSPSGTLTLNLPFAAPNLTDSSDDVRTPCVLQNHGDGGIENPYVRILNGTSTAHFLNVTDAGGEEVIDETRVDTVFDIFVNFTYFAAT